MYPQVWPGVTAYPDFTDPDSQGWWTRWIDFYINTVGVNVGALWIVSGEIVLTISRTAKGSEKLCSYWLPMLLCNIKIFCERCVYIVTGHGLMLLSFFFLSDLFRLLD